MPYQIDDLKRIGYGEEIISINKLTPLIQTTIRFGRRTSCDLYYGIVSRQELEDRQFLANVAFYIIPWVNVEKRKPALIKMVQDYMTELVLSSIEHDNYVAYSYQLIRFPRDTTATKLVFMSALGILTQ